MLRTVKLLSLTLGLLFSSPGWAWGPAGHMTVGAIADQLITGTKTAKQVRKLLGTNLRTASVWADCAKGVNDKTLTYGGDGKYRECAVYENTTGRAQMVSFVKRNASNCGVAPGSEPCHKQYHYTDVAIQRNAYRIGLVGTNDHDIVNATAAAIAMLEHGTAPAPFRFAGKNEAIRLLAHYLGDIHQPLHVAAIYLDADGTPVDPDQGRFDPKTETRGGNDILLAGRKLHSEWDGVPGTLHADELLPAALDEARAVPMTPGPMSEWATVWATETLNQGKLAFRGLHYSHEDPQHHYQAVEPAGYSSVRLAIQRQQIIKAGARLAQVLTTLWP